MSAHRYQSTWRGITFNRVYKTANEATVGPDDPARLDTAFANSDYRLESLDPHRVLTQDFRELRQFLEGAEANEAFEGVRFIEGRGIILGSTYADLEDKVWAFNEAFSPAACRVAFAANDPPNVGPFLFKRDSATGIKALQFYCRPGSGRPATVGRMRSGLGRRFTFTLMATDPFAYSQTETQTGVALGGGNVTNNGNLYTNPKIRIVFSSNGNAALTINNTTTGQSLVLDASASGTETWIIDVGRSLIYRLSDGVNRYPQRVSGFVTQMFLAVGVNAISFANTTGVSSVRFDFRDAYA